MSLHSDKAFHKARSLGASASRNRHIWECLMSHSKRELAEVAIHMAAAATGQYETALAGGDADVISALERFQEEIDCLKSGGMI